MQQTWSLFKPQVWVFTWVSLNDLRHCHSDSLNFSRTLKIAYSSILFFLFLITLHPEVQQYYLKFSPNSSLSLHSLFTSPRLHICPYLVNLSLSGPKKISYPPAHKPSLSSEQCTFPSLCSLNYSSFFKKLEYGWFTLSWIHSYIMFLLLHT